MKNISQEINDMIVSLFNDGKDENFILGEIIGNGVQFNRAKGTLNTVLVESGLKLTKEKREEKAKGIIEAWTATENTTIEEVTAKIEEVKVAASCTNAQAKGYVKAAFDAEELTMPKATTKRAPKTTGFAGDAKLTSDFLLENPDITKDDLATFMAEQGIDKSKGGSDKVQRFWNFMLEIKTFANSWCEAGNCK